MAMHEEDALERLRSEVVKILLLPSSQVPQAYKSQFEKLREYSESCVKSKNLNIETYSPPHVIRRKTAAKFIKLLIDIEDRVRDE